MTVNPDNNVTLWISAPS